MIPAARIIFSVLVSLLLAPPAQGKDSAASAPAKKGLRDLITDDEDGQLDVSEMLFAPSRFSVLPIPILITEPAVGYGGGLVPVWFHQRPDRSGGQLVPPSVSLLAGFLTSDGSRGGAGGHFHSWNADLWRLFGFAGRAALELESAGVSARLNSDVSLAYSIETTFLLLEGSRKVTPRTRVGLRYIYAGSAVDVGREEEMAAGDRSLAGDSAVGGLGLLVGFDSRDNLLSPTQGHRLDLRPAWFGNALGGDAEYLRVDAAYAGYWNRGAIGYALRVDANWIGDAAPFYAKPFISLRGVPVMAFLGQQVLAAEPELAWNLTPRWSLLAFGGAGRARNDFAEQGTIDREVYAGGAGFRYLLSRVLGLRAGLDVARNSEGDHAFYIVVGSPWL